MQPLIVDSYGAREKLFRISWLKSSGRSQSENCPNIKMMLLPSGKETEAELLFTAQSLLSLM